MCPVSDNIIGVLEVETMAWLKLLSICFHMGELIAPRREMWSHRPVVEQHDGDVSHMSKPPGWLSSTDTFLRRLEN